MTSRKLLFKIQVQIGQKTEELLVHSDDSPEILCQEFIEAHNLPSTSFHSLLQEIHSCIDELAKTLPIPSEPNKISRSCETSSLFTRLSTPKNLTFCKNPKVHKLESSNTETRFRLLCSFKEKQEIFPFKPELNPKSIKLTQSRITTPISLMKPNKTCSKLSHEQKPVETNNNKKKLNKTQAKQLANRLIGYLKVKEKKIDLIKKSDDKKFEKFFTPKIIKVRPSSVKTPEKKKLNYDFIKRDWKKILKIQDPNEKKSNRSSVIVDKKKKKRMAEIFALLNPINDKVHIRFIDFARIPRDLLKIICPLLEELAEVDDGLEFLDFVAAMENLMKMLSVDEKSIILDTKKKCCEIGYVNVFKPSLSTTSIKVSGSMLDRNRAFIETKDKYIEEGQKAKILADLSLCTFSPKTVKFDRSLYSSSLNYIPKVSTSN